jgi:hypothetical protein
MLVIGTSAVVQLAASLVHAAKDHGAAVVEVNAERAFSNANYYLEGKARMQLPRLISEIELPELLALDPGGMADFWTRFEDLVVALYTLPVLFTTLL